MGNLYKVKVETELMVMASNQKEAVSIGISAAPNEMAVYGKGNASVVNHILEIPEDWKNVIPYSKEPRETKKCYEIVSSIYAESKKEMAEEDIQEIIKIRENSKNVNEVIPENRRDPKPKELPWSETKSGRPLPYLRFKI